MEEECVDLSINDDGCNSEGHCVSATLSRHLYLQNVIHVVLSVSFNLFVFTTFLTNFVTKLSYT